MGKTRVTCWIARILTERGFRVGLCKPAVTGAVQVGPDWIWEDVEQLRSACSAEAEIERIAPFRWYSPLAPPAAEVYDRQLSESGKVPPSPKQGVALSQYLESLDAWENKCDCLITEGIGGLLCPLTATETVADLAVSWGRPVLIVSRLGLGTLNHTLMTFECANRRGLPVAGVLLNQTVDAPWGAAEHTNPIQLRNYLPVPVWGPLPFQSADNIPEPLRGIQWEQIVL